MVGIKAFGTYIPRHRLTAETVGWTVPGERAVANFDEDSVTMAVAAAENCLAHVDRSQIDGLIFASTTSPYWEKQSASTVAVALDLKRNLFSHDVSGTLRGGTSALQMAADAVSSGRAKEVLVVAADCRMAYPRSSLEPYLGDGAAAVLVGNTNVIAEIEDSFFVSDHMVDVWRSEGDTFVRSGEDRFIMEAGYVPVLIEAITGLATKLGKGPKDFAKVVYYSPDPRRHAEIGRRIGAEATQVQEPGYGAVGNTGTAFPLMLLAAALETAKPRDRIMLAGYGDGADAYSLVVTGAITKAPKPAMGVLQLVASKTSVAAYEDYLRWRGQVAQEPARRPDPQPISLQAAWRDRETNLRFHGAKCTSCGEIQHPPQKVCSFCRAVDQWEMVRLSDKGGVIKTYSMDHVAGTQDVPLVLTVVDFNGGGRSLMMMTDRKIDDIKVGLPVEMSFRKLDVIDGIHNYYWKSMPVRVPSNGARPSGVKPNAKAKTATAKAGPKGKRGAK